MLMHAYRRTKATAIDLFGTTYEFNPNTDGHVVAEVTEPRAIARLLECDCHVYRAQVEATEPSEVERHSTVTFVLTNADDTLDLSTLDDKELRAFARDNDVTLAKTDKGDKIRAKIVDGLTKE